MLHFIGIEVPRKEETPPERIETPEAREQRIQDEAIWWREMLEWREECPEDFED